MRAWRIFWPSSPSSKMASRYSFDAGLRSRRSGEGCHAHGLRLVRGSDAEKRPKLLLLDGYSLAFRAFYALPEDLATTDGTHTNAVFGFTSMLIKVMQDEKPDLHRRLPRHGCAPGKDRGIRGVQEQPRARPRTRSRHRCL